MNKNLACRIGTTNIFRNYITIFINLHTSLLILCQIITIAMKYDALNFYNKYMKYFELIKVRGRLKKNIIIARLAKSDMTISN